MAHRLRPNNSAEAKPQSCENFVRLVSRLQRRVSAAAKTGRRMKWPVYVADYFNMLRMDLQEQPYKKSEHRSHLIARLNSRSDAAIELKHQNISAVLDEIGLPYISGYKPRKNFPGGSGELPSLH